MTAENRPIEIPDDEDQRFVPAVLARDADEAREYCELLGDHDIPARLGGDPQAEDQGADARQVMTRGVPVLVPETFLDEAGEIIADRDEADEFEGGELSDEEEGSDLLDDGFLEDEEEPDDDDDEDDEEEVGFDNNLLDDIFGDDDDDDFDFDDL